MASLRVLHVVSRQQRRGAETVALELAEEMSHWGMASEVVALGPVASGEPEPRLRVLWHGGGIRGPSLVPIVWFLRRELQARRPDVVLAHGGQAALASVLAKRGLDIPIVWQRILELPRFDQVYVRRLVWPFVAGRTAAAVAITRRHVEEMQALGFQGPLLLEPNHRRWARFAELDRERCRAALREELAVDASIPLISFVGHLVEQKRPELAVEVLRRCACPDARLLIVGAGPLEEAVRNAAAATGLADRVILLGHRNDVPHILAGSDVLIVTSGSETMTGVMIEAQMAGCPVVSFALDGADIVVRDGETGHIVSLDDVDAMAGAVCRILHDPERRTTMGRAATERGRFFSTERAAGRYASFLREVAAAAAVPRVLFLLPNFGVGGAERALLMIARHAEEGGFLPFVASLGPPRRDESETVLGDLRDLGVEVVDLGVRGRADRSLAALASAALRLRRLCRRLRIDVVDSCLFEADLVARLAVRGTGIRHVVHLVNTPYDAAVQAHSRGGGSRRFHAVRTIDRASSRLSDRFVAISHAVAAAAVRDLGVPRARLEVVPRGVDLEEFHVRPLVRSVGEPLRVLSVGRLVPQKDHRTAIEAMRVLQDAGLDVTYTVAGEGILSAELAEAVEQAGLAGRVTLVPPTREVAALHACHHVFCFPSLWEGQGNALIEAMACGRPVVASDLPALREVLGDDGVYFPAGDADALASRLREMAGWSPQRLADSGAALRARAERRFAAPAQAKRLGSIYRSLLQPRLRPVPRAALSGLVE